MRTRGDDGAAVAEFALTVWMLTALFLGILQVGIAFHVRNVVAASLAEGARYAANADVADPEAGAARANELIRKAIGGRFAVARAGDPTTVDGAPVVTVQADAPMPLIAAYFPPRFLHVHLEGHALQER